VSIKYITEGKLLKKLLPNGKVYEGFLKDGVPHGYGIMMYENNIKRLKFGWEVEEEEMYDLGGYTLVFSLFEKYEGSWRNGLWHGYGRLTFTDGVVFDGLWENGETAHYGRMELRDGEVYTGIWSDFKPDTFGAYSYSNGDCYVGEWCNGAKHGQGVYTYADGSRYEGNFDNDEFSGDGTLYESGIAKSVNWSRQGKQRRILPARRNCV